MPFKWVPNAAETAGGPILAAASRYVRAATVEFTPLAKSDDGYFGFCPAKSQLYRFVVKPQAPAQRPSGRFALLFVLLFLLLADGR